MSKNFMKFSVHVTCDQGSVLSVDYNNCGFVVDMFSHNAVYIDN